MLEGDEPECVEQAEQSLADYRTAAVFGELSALEALTAELDELNDEFHGWVEAVNPLSPKSPLTRKSR